MRVSILSLDLSKASTGFCLSTSYLDTDGMFPEWWVESTRSGSIACPPQQNFTFKHPHVAIRHIQDAIDQILKEHEAKGKPKPQVTMEHPVFGEFSSPLQFYLHQSMLDFFERRNMFVVTYSNGLIKSFMAGQVNQVSEMKDMDKDFLKAAYTQAYGKTVPLVYKKPENLTSSDELDAIILNMLGIQAQAYTILTVLEKYAGKEEQGFHDVMETERFLTKDLFHNTFTGQGLVTLKGFTISATSQKFIAKRLQKNKHLSKESKTFYPYPMLKRLEDVFAFYRKQPEKEKRDWLKELKDYLGMNQVLKMAYTKEGKWPPLYCNFDGKIYGSQSYIVKE